MSERGYGRDETDDFETLAEAERQPDGSVAFRVVQLDKTQCRRPYNDKDKT